MSNIHFCDICNKLARVLMFPEYDVWYCFDCADDYDAAQIEDENVCPDCHGLGGNKWNDGVTPCKTCGERA